MLIPIVQLLDQPIAMTKKPTQRDIAAGPTVYID